MRSSHEPRHRHVSSAEFWLYNKYKKINGNDFVIDTREVTKNFKTFLKRLFKTCSGVYNSSGIGQGCGSPIIHNTSSGTCKDSAKITSTTTNCVSKEKKKNYQSVITSNTKRRTELSWWIENSKFCNGRTFSQLNPLVIIQTGASLAG